MPHEHHRCAFTRIAGRVGDSHLSGDLAVTRRPAIGRALLEADMRSNALDWDDLLAVLGGAPSTAPGETASPEERAMAARLRAQDRLPPNAKLDIVRLRRMDARALSRSARAFDALAGAALLDRPCAR